MKQASRMGSRRVKLAVVSHVLPPSWSGQAVMLHRLLRKWDPADYCLISTKDYNGSDPYVHSATNALPGSFHHLPPECFTRPFRVGGRLGRAVSRLALMLLHSVNRARKIAEIVRSQSCDAVMACSGGDGLDIPASFLAAIWTKRPFYAYIFDDYVYQWTDKVQRFYASCWGHLVLRASKCVIVPNEFLANAYEKRYGIQPSVVRNPCEALATEPTSAAPWPENEGEIKIVFTGAIYDAHYDAFHNILGAIKLLQPTNFRLHLYTTHPQESLLRHGICGPVTCHAHLPNEEILAVQAKSDVLFLPLAFDSPYPQVVNTSAPGKIGEYLASGRPILVHAPSDSFVSWYFRRYQCGMVVDRPDSVALAQAIQKLCEDPCLRTELVERAFARYQVDFSLPAVQDQFQRAFFPEGSWPAEDLANMRTEASGDFRGMLK